MAQIPEWLGITETIAFFAAIGTFGYNRLVSWRKFSERTADLEAKFSVFARDFDSYIKTCEFCRIDVRKHHENSLIHITDSFTDRMQDIADRVRNVERMLMKLNGNHEK